jgi:hypothetical protein
MSEGIRDIMPEGLGGIFRRLWRAPLTGFLLFVLAGCHTTGAIPPEPRIVIQEKVTPVHAPCTPSNVAPAPSYPDTDEALRNAAGADERYKLVIAGRELRNARLGVVEPVIEGCRK